MYATQSWTGRTKRWLIASVIAISAFGLFAGATVAPDRAEAAGQVLGMDVSGHQGNVDWQTAYNNGARFAYAKATEGGTYKNPYFAQQYNGSRNVGMIRGAYHFALPDSSTSAVGQANFFIDNGGGWSADGKTLPPALDIEYNPYGATCYGLSQSAMVTWIKAFSNQIHARTNKYPMIYSTFDWWNTCTGNSSALSATNPFWIARYSSSPPSPIPAGASTWTIWQYAKSGTFPGDQDKFNGSYSQLQALATNSD